MERLYLQHWKFSQVAQGATDARRATVAPWTTDPLRVTGTAQGDPWSPGFDDSAWQDVIVPHDWAVSFPFSQDHSSGTGYLPGGTGWYRTVFSVPAGAAAKKVFVNFDGVYKNSQVWCNGHYLGGRASGYSSFSRDISHCVHEGDDNIIAVKAAHEDIADSRWYTGSGIYRKVSVDIHDPVYIPAASIVVRSTVTGEGKDADTVTGKADSKADGSAVVRVTAELRSPCAVADICVTLPLYFTLNFKRTEFF